MYTRANQKITIQARATASISGGCFTETWTTASGTSSSTIWANVQIAKTLEDWQKEKATI